MVCTKISKVALVYPVAHHGFGWHETARQGFGPLAEISINWTSHLPPYLVHVTEVATSFLPDLQLDRFAHKIPLLTSKTYAIDYFCLD